MRWHIGLMTGTVLDGNIDVAFLRTDGKIIEEFGYYDLRVTIICKSSLGSSKFEHAPRLMIFISPQSQICPKSENL